MWCPSPALDHVLCVHRKNGAVTLNIPVEQELEEGTRLWEILFAVFDELFVENLAHPLERVCLPLVAEETFAQLVGHC